jgi:glycosyltransferase involved in cell wall biosynthesis
MKLLIVTQVVDREDAVLGFFCDWISELAKYYEKIEVLCLSKGSFDLPTNVRVYSLGKESKKPVRSDSLRRQARRIKYLFKYLAYIKKRKNDYDEVLVHMIPLYAVLGAVIWRPAKKRVSLWYAHGHVPFGLKLSEKLVDHIFTANRESCRVDSQKVIILGHGIDTEKFEPIIREKRKDGFFRIISIGRIAPIKDYETLIRAIGVIVKKYRRREVRCQIIGAALLDQHENYFHKLRRLVAEENLEKYLEFVGSVPYTNIIQYFSEADIMASASRTGSLDKAMLEAMSMKLPVLSCNEAMSGIFTGYRDQLFYQPGDYEDLAKKIIHQIETGERGRKEIGSSLREIVINDHSLSRLAIKIKECAE